MRAKFLYYTKAIGKYWQQSGRYDLAAECYQTGIEIDDLAEELYQQLMVCHHQLGQEAEVVKIYYRCRAMLHNAFGLEPSEKNQGNIFLYTPERVIPGNLLRFPLYLQLLLLYYTPFFSKKLFFAPSVSNL